MVTDLVSLLDKYACAFIHPTQELVDYVNHGFKTKEDIKYLITTIIAIIAILGGMFKEELKVLWDWIWQLVEWMF